MKLCPKCKQSKPLEEFHKNRASKDGHTSYCAECAKLTSRLQVLNDDGRLKEQKRQWDIRNPDRRAAREIRRGMRLIGKQEEWESLCRNCGYRCLACGETKNLTVDHVVALARGGSGDIANIQPLCMDCNRKKLCNEVDYRLDLGLLPLVLDAVSAARLKRISDSRCITLEEAISTVLAEAEV
jgi:5-methylcytosine-specific restriction endonuclease McrA